MVFLSFTSLTGEMQGVGKKAGPNTLFYGSVHDESGQAASLETKIKKRYWETKQSLIQALGKDQDEHFIADDADIDLRLQVKDHSLRGLFCVCLLRVKCLHSERDSERFIRVKHTHVTCVVDL